MINMKEKNIRVIEHFDTEPEETVDSKLEFLKHMSSVHHGLKDDVTPDFIFAKLSAQDKEGVTEMASNAYYGVRLLQGIKANHTLWDWDASKKHWKRRYLNNIEKKRISTFQKNLFSAFMTRVFLTITTNINVKDNYHIRLMSGLPEEEERNKETEEEETSFLGRLKSKLKLNKSNE